MEQDSNTPSETPFFHVSENILSNIETSKHANVFEKMIISRENVDSVVFSIIKGFKERAEFGFKKYGTNLDRTDLSVLQWIQHAQEEHMDAILYLEKLKQMFSDTK
jgi:hypothetical protein